MGNICDYTPNTEYEERNTVISVYPTRKLQTQKTEEADAIYLPTINTKVKSILQLKSTYVMIEEPLQAEFNKIIHKCQFKELSPNNIYYGEINEGGIAHGAGKIFKENGDMIIGEFENGIPNGRIHYISTNQTYYSGIAIHGQLNCDKGIMQSSQYKYEGGFKNNKFQNYGVQISQNSKFEGLFANGKKKKGKLTWIANGHTYQYDGFFNSDQKFSDNGILTEPFGQYEGAFQNGQKHGYGVYTYNSQLRYEGEYRFGKKEGKGKLLNIGNILCYEGQFVNGLPNGAGKGFKGNQIICEGIFSEGIFTSGF